MKPLIFGIIGGGGGGGQEMGNQLGLGGWELMVLFFCSSQFYEFLKFYELTQFSIMSLSYC